jgi:uncharacterized protein YdhG (YjbR/CyaY superfamily)
VSADEIDGYLAKLDEPHRSTLTAVRRTIAAIVPEAEEGLAYGAPAFRIGGKVVAGFSAAKRHLSYLPHSGTVLSTVDPAVLEGYKASKGALQFPVDQPITAAVVGVLIAARQAEIAG